MILCVCLSVCQLACLPACLFVCFSFFLPSFRPSFLPSCLLSFFCYFFSFFLSFFLSFLLFFLTFFFLSVYEVINLSINLSSNLAYPILSICLFARQGYNIYIYITHMRNAFRCHNIQSAGATFDLRPQPVGGAGAVQTGQGSAARGGPDVFPTAKARCPKAARSISPNDWCTCPWSKGKGVRVQVLRICSTSLLERG